MPQVIDELRSRGLAVGKDMSVVSAEAGLLATKGSEALPAGTRPSPFAFGTTAAETMLALSDGTLAVPKVIELESVWVEGESLGAVKVDAAGRNRC